MATVPSKDIQEGKRMAARSYNCDACETYLAVKVCAQCPMNLCGTCAKGHQKIKYTKDHILTDLGDAISTVQSTSALTSGNCSKHKSDKVTHLCKDCIQLICKSCQPAHNGHSLEHLNDDPKIYQKVCGKHIQQLIDDLQEVEELKTILEGHISAYDEAIIKVETWELELLQMVKDKASALRKKLKGLKDEKFKQLSDKVNGLMVKINEIDGAIGKLNNIRRSMEFQLLSKELTASQELIDKLEGYKSELTYQPVPDVDDILQNGEKIKNVGYDLELIFTVDEFGSKCPKPVAEWKFSKSNNGKDKSIYGENPVTMKNLSYCAGPNGETDGAVIYPTNASTQIMAVMNPSSRLRFSTTMTFFAHLYLEDTHQGLLFSYCNTGSYCGRLLVHPNNKSLRICDMGTDVIIQTTNLLTPNTWQRIAVVWDISKMSFYVDGSLVYSHAVTVDLTKTQHGDIYFSFIPNGETCIMGRIASAKFFNSALIESEIKSLK